jgi:hypothetical protein
MGLVPTVSRVRVTKWSRSQRMTREESLQSTDLVAMIRSRGKQSTKNNFQKTSAFNVHDL